MGLSPASLLVDSDGNVVKVTQDGDDYKVEVLAKVRNVAGTIINPAQVEVIGAASSGVGTPVCGKDTAGNIRLIRLSVDGTQISTSTILPTNLSRTINEPVLDSGNSDDLLVDGSSTPVVFQYVADATYDAYINEIKFVFVALAIDYDGGHFLRGNSLTNGVQLDIRSEDNTVNMFNFKYNEDFLAFSGGASNDFLDKTGVTDIQTASLNLGSGVKLVGGSGDFIKVTIQDDIDAAGHYWFKCYVKGHQESV